MCSATFTIIRICFIRFDLIKIFTEELPELLWSHDFDLLHILILVVHELGLFFRRVFKASTLLLLRKLIVLGLKLIATNVAAGDGLASGPPIDRVEGTGEAQVIRLLIDRHGLALDLL